MYTPYNWFGIGGRADVVEPDIDATFPDGGSKLSFKILSPRLVFKTAFVTHEAITVMYQHYLLGASVSPVYPYESWPRPTATSWPSRARCGGRPTGGSEQVRRSRAPPGCSPRRGQRRPWRARPRWPETPCGPSSCLWWERGPSTPPHPGARDRAGLPIRDLFSDFCERESAPPESRSAGSSPHRGGGRSRRPAGWNGAAAGACRRLSSGARRSRSIRARA